MFNKKSRIGSRILIVLLFIWIMSAPPLLYPGGEKQKERGNELRLWHSVGTYNKGILTQLIDTYNENRKQTVVKAVFQGNEEDLYLKLLSQENLPDLVLLPVHYIPDLHEKNYLFEITSYIPNKLREDISNKYWKSVSVNGGIYGVPFSFNSNILFVNQHILRISGTRHEREPETWEEIFSIIRKIRDNTDGKWGIFIPMETLAHFISFVQSYAGKPVFQDQKFRINHTEAISAMAYLQDLVYQHALMPPKVTVNEGEQIFLSGNLGMMMASSSILVYTQINLPYNLTVWHLPTPETTPVITGSCLAVIKTDRKNEKLAIDFIEYLMSYESTIKWQTHTGTPAIRTSAMESLDLLIFYEENPNYMTPVIELERGSLFYPRPHYLEINKIIKKALEEIMINGKNPALILNTAQIEIDGL